MSLELEKSVWTFQGNVFKTTDQKQCFSFSPNRPTNDVQIAAFVKQLQLAKEKNFPVIIVSKKSFLQVLKHLTMASNTIFKKSIIVVFFEKELHDEHPIEWRNFDYGIEELEMVQKYLKKVFFGCSTQTIMKDSMKSIIKHLQIWSIIPESVAPHITVPQVR